MKTDAPAIGVHYDARYERHETGKNHPESPERYRVLREALEKLPAEFVRLPGKTATLEEILLAHEPHYPDVVRRDVDEFSDMLRTGDTTIGSESYDVALEATGAVLSAVDAVMNQTVLRAFCAVRPPGHHATASRGMGFCIFNHVAIAANYLREKYDLKRIAIIDWDVHHGNGTEAIFVEDPDVFYLSLHENGSYPNTGTPENRGIGRGLGSNLNLPLPTGSNGDLALKTWDESAAPALEKFSPEFVLVSAGFDARKNEPISNLKWEDETFEKLTRRVVALAKKSAGGRLVSVLEGGYNPKGLASAAVAHVQALKD